MSKSLPLTNSETTPKGARAQGFISATFDEQNGQTFIRDVHESGGWRLRHPRGELCEAVIVNTSGGILGGDVVNLQMVFNENAHVVITSQAAEKIYKSDRDRADMHIALKLHKKAYLAWLPQEMIFFNGASFNRRFDIDMHEDSQLTLIESNIYGRLAMGEILSQAYVRDRWRIRRNKKLIFAEDMFFEGDIVSQLNHPAIGAGARASALIIHIGAHLGQHVENVRHILTHMIYPLECGVSTWGEVLVARLLAHDPSHLRQASQNILRYLRGHDMPRVWQ
jgi:urease accessory protein